MNEQLMSLPAEDRPYEKCLQKGPQALTNRELLAVVLRTGSKGRNVLDLASELLHLIPEQEGFTGLRRLPLEELSRIRGIGKVKALQLKCTLEIARRMSRETHTVREGFRCAQDVADCYMEDMRHLEQEVMLLLMLNQKGRLLKEEYIFRGTVNTAPASPREIFLEALSARAVQIILLHNHPSGDCRPSQEDFNVTRQIAQAGELLGITLADHIIIGDCDYMSFRESNYL